ncbi:pseudouridine synthase [Cellulosilyticum sp. I15G10I2]|uniref:pseudouridine synthase n=1 Tax=Cellulosilyticum sp. I15G10I2 TaxID=1892843 RepID=UPI001A9A53F0|nr:16S rRNA pseudouridine(516) synthase [Cellulosilyticum sp. I15G10I2]
MQVKKIRIDKFLVHIGYGSRSEVHKLIKEKRVTLNDKIIHKPDMHLIIEESKVCVDGGQAVYQEFYYYVLNKPQGVITATEDKRYRTVMDLLLPIDQRKSLAPVGRLDKDTEGLLILTNDGKLTHELLSPKKHVDKVYYAKIRGMITLQDVKQFEEGIILEDGTSYRSSKLEILHAGDISEIYVTISEGKFHQVKRMVMSVGKEVIYLKRIKMGALELPEDLNIGEYRQLTELELKLLKGEKQGDRTL